MPLVVDICAMLAWTLVWLWQGRWPTHDSSGIALRGRDAGHWSADGWYAVLLLLKADFEYLQNLLAPDHMHNKHGGAGRRLYGSVLSCLHTLCLNMPCCLALQSKSWTLCGRISSKITRLGTLLIGSTRFGCPCSREKGPLQNSKGELLRCDMWESPC